MRRKFVAGVLLSALLLLSLYMMNVSAGLIDYERLNRIKARREGKVMQDSSGREKDLPKWMKVEPKVSSKTEKAYDVNRDGKLQTAEVKVYLREVLNTIDDKGGYAIDSNILKEYDKNKDGVISRYEAEDLGEFVR